MANEVFIDTSGFFAVLDVRDVRHALAARILRDAQKRKRRFVTTDYVLDETATLLKARQRAHLLVRLFETIDATRACRVEWTGADRFDETRAYFLKHADQAWSFTDCLSFRVMSQFRLREALTKDAHFEQSGFVALLR